MTRDTHILIIWKEETLNLRIIRNHKVFQGEEGIRMIQIQYSIMLMYCILLRFQKKKITSYANIMPDENILLLLLLLRQGFSVNSEFAL